MNIGKRIKERRIELNMSMEQLAKKLGKNRSTVYRYETGEIENMPLDLLKPIADALQTTPAWLIGWEQDQIDALSEVQKDADEYNDSVEYALKDFVFEISEMGFDPSEIKRIMDFAKIINKKESGSEELHIAFIDLFIDMYNLGLTKDDLQDIYTYAQFIKAKKG